MFVSMSTLPVTIVLPQSPLSRAAEKTAIRTDDSVTGYYRAAEPMCVKLRAEWGADDEDLQLFKMVSSFVKAAV